MTRATQTSAVLAHMRKFGGITSMEAFKEYGATRLSGLIFELRKRGFQIVTEMQSGVNRFGGSCCYAKYVLIEDDQNKQELSN